MILSVLGDAGRLVHGAGPAGLPGGWPVRLWADRAEIDLPPDITFEEALAVNLEGQRSGGVTEVDAAGGLHLAPAVADMMDELFGVEVAHIPVDRLAALAAALRAGLERRVAEGG
jgi:hypothetical protein